MTGRRVLIVTPSLPYPPHWGFGMRVYQFLRHLAAQHRVTLVTYTDGSEAARANGDVLRQLGLDLRSVQRREPGGPAKRGAQLASLLTTEPYQYHLVWSREMQRTITGILAEQPYDVVQVESSQLTVFKLPPGPVRVLDEHNIEYELLYRMARAESSPIRKFYNLVEHAKFRRAERAAWQHFDGCVLTSERERQTAAREAPQTPTLTVPNGVDLDYFAPQPAPASAEIVFTGHMDYRPNIDAALHFAREILPLVRQSRPDATFTVVGQGPPAELVRLAGPGLAVTGAVPDVRPYLARAAVVVVPLRMGSGTRLKVLEGLAMARPMVSTSLGCEGIDVEDGRHLLVAGDPPAFAASVLRLLDDPALGARLGAEGRGLAERGYGWAAAAKRLDAFHSELCERRAAGRAGDGRQAAVRRA